jgi:23S rRNA pseudouridine1911/1915/1917 synthase
MPKIIYKSKNAVVIEKPVGMPAQSDPTGDLDAMTATSMKLGELGERDALWLVHRLDRNVGGVMAFARSSESAAKLSREIADGIFEKEYLAVAEGRVESGSMSDYLFKDSTKSKAFVVNGARKGAKLALLDCECLETAETESGELSLVRIKLKTGRFHQIRAQLSARGTPLVGDQKYGSRVRGARTPALFACRLATASVRDGKGIVAYPDTEQFPWNLFSKDYFCQETEK